MESSYYVCERCAHYYAAPEPPERCENCRVHGSWLSEWPDIDSAEDASAAVLFMQRQRGAARQS